MSKKNKVFIFSMIALVIAIIAIVVILNIMKNDGTYVNGVKRVEFAVESENIDSFKHKKEIDGSHLYYLGIDDILIDGVDLVKYLDANDISNLKKNFNRVHTYDDGGSELYTCDDEKKCDDDLKVLFCNTEKGDRDVYIANKNLDIDAEYCVNSTK